MTKDAPAADLDALCHDTIGRLTMGLSPAALATAYLDWALHLAASPQKQMALARLAVEPPAAPNGPFGGEAWQAWPFRAYAQAFEASTRWWQAATTDVKGVEPKHANIVGFATRQMLDIASPANALWTNPEVLQRVAETSGQNLIDGAHYWFQDLRHALGADPRAETGFRVGETLATTEGDVVLRTDLVELIRYRPTTTTVRPEPILLVPAWIMKYYILDLHPGRSMVEYLLGKGFEVYALSWRNPGAEDAGYGLQDYIDLGVRAALDHIAPGPQDRVHGVGYCLGGTLLAMTAAAMGRDGDARLASLSLLAAQVDFSEPGEIGLYINESQVAFLEDMMRVQGYLRADQMAGAFTMLRSGDLVWGRVVHQYLMGERPGSSALMAWNADTTRMPAKMHSEYLRQLYLGNALSKGRFRVDQRPVAITDIRCPAYVLGTETDHVSPWRSVYKFLLLSDTDVTFALTNGGHNAGVLSEPGHKGRRYRTLEKLGTGHDIAADDWLAGSAPQTGSWWVHWARWLSAKSAARIPAHPAPEHSLGPAPGTYVFG